MKAGAAVTRNPNAYEAGLALGDSLARLAPDLVLVFGTGHYASGNQLVEGLFDAIDRPELVVVGNAGDGYYSAIDSGDLGASALGITFGPGTRLHLATATGVATDTAAAVRAVLDGVDATIGDRASTHVFLQVDVRADPVVLEELLCGERRFPIVGGLVSDLHGLAKAAIFANRQLVVDGAVALAIEGPHEVRVHVANRFEWTSAIARVDVADGTIVRSIEGRRATEFVERETKRPLQLPSSSVSLLTIVDDAGASSRVRGIVADYEDSTGALRLYGRIVAGDRVRAGTADPESMLADVRALGASLSTKSRRPVAGLLLSCNGRRWLLGSRAPDEVRALVDALGPIPLVGFPSFAELAPVTNAPRAMPSALHNMTYVLVLFGP